jgi:hypothetical protein
MDGRKYNRGTVGNKGGRPKKADEEKTSHAALKAVIKVFGSEEGAFEFLASDAKGSFPHLRLLMEYAYGKPTEKISQEVTMPQLPQFTWSSGTHGREEEQ